jgi:hypothetical protein
LNTTGAGFTRQCSSRLNLRLSSVAALRCLRLQCSLKSRSRSLKPDFNCDFSSHK